MRCKTIKCKKWDYFDKKCGNKPVVIDKEKLMCTMTGFGLKIGYKTTDKQFNRELVRYANQIVKGIKRENV
jgi:hypothetical protein